MELLIVIVIIVVIAVLALGMYRKVMMKAKIVASTSGMRQVSVGTLNYSVENQGALNRVIFSNENELLNEPIPGLVDLSVSNTFWGRLQPYLFADTPTTNQPQLSAAIKRGLEVMLSTKDLNTMQGTPFHKSRIYEDTSGLRLPFAFNSSIYEPNKLNRTQSFDDLGRIVYFTYGWELFEQSDAQAAVPLPITNPATQSNIYWYDDGTAAFIFLDGHLEVLKPGLSIQRFR